MKILLLAIATFLAVNTISAQDGTKPVAGTVKKTTTSSKKTKHTCNGKCKDGKHSYSKTEVEYKSTPNSTSKKTSTKTTTVTPAR